MYIQHIVESAWNTPSGMSDFHERFRARLYAWRSRVDIPILLQQSLLRESALILQLRLHLHSGKNCSRTLLCGLLHTECVLQSS